MDTSVTIEEIDEEFKKFGPIFTSKLQTDSEGNSLGYGYVQFEDSSFAEKALEEAGEQGIKVGEHFVKIEKFLQRKDRNILPSNANNLYVRNLPGDVDNEELKKKIDAVFGKYGKITSSLVRDDPRGKGKFAFICFENIEMAANAQKELAGTENPFSVEDPLYINIAQKQSERAKEQSDLNYKQYAETNIFVKNLKKSVSVEDLKSNFGVFGEIVSLAIRNPKEMNPSAQSKFAETLYAFINFKEKQSAVDAISKGPQDPSIRGLFEESPIKGGQGVFINQFMPRGLYKAYKDSKKRLNSMYTKPMYPGMNFGGFGGNRGGMPQMGMEQPQMPYYMYNPQFQMGNQQRRGGYNNRGGPRNYNNQGGQRRGGAPMQGGYQMHQRGGYPGVGPRGGGMHRGGYRPANNPPPVNVKLEDEKEITLMKIKAKLEEFKSLDNQTQRNMLGELLFPMVKELVDEPSLAPKVTGMLIDFDVFEIQEILDFIENEEELKERVKEAVELISADPE